MLQNAVDKIKSLQEENEKLKSDIASLPEPGVCTWVHERTCICMNVLCVYVYDFITVQALKMNCMSNWPTY